MYLKHNNLNFYKLNSMTKIEYFFPRLNGWLSLSLDDYINLVFTQTDNNFNYINNFRHMPIKIKLNSDENSEPFLPSKLISGNYVEIFLQQELNLLSVNPKGTIILNPKKENQNIYDCWVQAKIISFDLVNNLLFLEYNDQIIIIDDLVKVRSLTEKKFNNKNLVLYYVKKISNSEYETIKKEIETLTADNNKNLFYKYDIIKSSLIFLGQKDIIPNLLKDLEQRYKSEESNNNSEFSATSRSEHSEEGSEKSEKKSKNSKLNEADILDQINNYKYKESFVFKNVFKKDAEKILKNIIIKNKFYITANNEEEFKIIIYGNDENNFYEEKNNFENNYKGYELSLERIINNKSEISLLAKKAKVKYIYFSRNYLYLIGEEKRISNFKVVLSLNMSYAKEIQKTNKETENIKKELNDFKKKNKLK